MRFAAKISAALFLICAMASPLVVSASQTANQQPSSNSAQSGTHNQQLNSEQIAKSDIKQQKQQAEQNAQKSLDQEAIAAVKETKQAIDAINANRTDQALAAIERATGKINVLLARNPSTALIPVSSEVHVIDTAPHDTRKIREIATDASWAVEARNFPAARVLLEQLLSEIRVRTYNLPLATYPLALQRAAQLLDQKKSTDAAATLQTALSTLVAVDKVTPIPLVVARAAINQSQTQGQKDTNNAHALLEVAKYELQRARELGYAGKDKEYVALNDQISNLEKQLSSNGETNSIYAKLKERLSAFLNRQSQQQNGQSQTQRTAQVH